MTRFARAKGSKASNERAPEDGTPWEVMKQQLLQAKEQDLDSKLREEAEQKRIKNYENFLKEQKIQKRKAVWCEFETNEHLKLHKLNNFNEPNTRDMKNKSNSESLFQENMSLKKKKQNKKKKNNNNLEFAAIAESNLSGPESEVCQNSSEKEKNHKKKKQNKDNIDIDGGGKSKADILDDINENKELENKPFKKKNKKHNNLKYAEQNSTNTENLEQSKRRKTGNQVSDSASKSPDETFLDEKFKDKKGKKQMFNNAYEKNNASNNRNIEESTPPQNKQSAKREKQKKKTKFLNGKPVRRKPIDDNTFQLIINGRDVELARFDGFIIMKKDEERLKDLKRNMTQKGIPKSEMQRTIKLERRRAEKALARLKRDVCYNCRKGGHNLSDCPDLKSKIPSIETADGVCFKCGSTEHRQFECKVQRDKEFRFATCFICKEQGHIARQCPDNPKGLYPNGGGCKLCGDVTHLKKDCPAINEKNESSNIKLSTIDSADNIEDLPDKPKAVSVAESTKKPKKIKF